ncbi:MAG: 4-hydroxythreonine-4-phosphate dehydrogenase PdxA [Sneathiella sp.]
MVGMALPPLALTMGDPAGIGIEIAVKAWHARKKTNLSAFCLIGTATEIQRQADSLSGDIPVRRITRIGDADALFNDAIPVLDIQNNDNPAAATLTAIETAVELCLARKASGLVTNPIQKKRLYDAGFKHPGHTEFLAELTKSEGPAVMMLACSELKVVPATIHVALEEVPSALSEEHLEHVIRCVDKDLQERFSIDKPRIVVAGLNPHAGENGSMGQEEKNMISPLVYKLAAEGLSVSGPFPADSLFHKAARQKYDAAICMYHDQALIPIKTIDFDRGVNVTLGLPIIRTSPDHGTADDIAGKGLANPASLIAALQMAAQMAAYSRHVS